MPVSLEEEEEADSQCPLVWGGREVVRLGRVQVWVCRRRWGERPLDGDWEEMWEGGRMEGVKREGVKGMGVWVGW